MATDFDPSEEAKPPREARRSVKRSDPPDRAKFPVLIERMRRDQAARERALIQVQAGERAEEDRKRLQRNLLAAVRRRAAKAG